jgi:quercetin dioxygenase-like cupin family protein
MSSRSIYFKGGVEVHFSLDAGDTAEQLSLFRCVINPGARTPVPHYHKDFDETVFALRGTVHYTVDDKAIELQAGNSLFIPRGAIHAFANKTREPIEFLCYVNPGIFGAGYFEDIAAVINAGGPPDVDKLQAIMQHYGLVPVIGLKHKILFAIVRLFRRFKK